MPPPGTSWRFSAQKFKELILDNRIYFGSSGNNVPRFKRFITDVQDGFVPTTLWFREEVGDNQEAKKEVKLFNPNEVFSTPKPERLIERIITLSTNPGDYVLDSFLGSGTTTAVAHKMGRKWIGIELGEHAYTHCLVRMKKVIDGEKGGISQSVNWESGGGFGFFEIGSSLLVKDKYGNLVLNKTKLDSKKMTEAICIINGYKYLPESEIFWKNGESNENSFIFVTTEYVCRSYFDQLRNEMLGIEKLLICCPAFDIGLNELEANIMIKKIPQSILDSCEYDVDSYEFNILESSQNPEDSLYE